MEAKYLVLDKEILRLVLTQSEFDILEVIVKKVNKIEGTKVYRVEATK